MKQHRNILTLLIVFAVVCLASVLAKAQTSNVPSFFQSAQSYFTDFNTNLVTFHSDVDHVDLSLGTENVANQNIEAVFKVDANLYKGFGVGGSFYNDSVFGKVTHLDAGPSYSYVLYDVKATASLNAGCDFQNGSHAYLRPDLDLKKALTTHTFAGIGIDLKTQLAGKQNLTPGIRIETGFNF